MAVRHIYAYIGVLAGESTHFLADGVLSKEQKLSYLKEMTDEDFGYDAKAWEDYFDQYDLYTLEGIRAAFKGKKRREKEEKLRKENENPENKNE